MSQPEKPGCGWTDPLPDFQQKLACQSCHKLRSAGDVTRCRLRGGPKIEGLGDVIAKVTHATGIAQAIEIITGGGCGCAGRQALLNKLIPLGSESQEFTDEAPDPRPDSAE